MMISDAQCSVNAGSTVVGPYTKKKCQSHLRVANYHGKHRTALFHTISMFKGNVSFLVILDFWLTGKLILVAFASLA